MKRFTFTTNSGLQISGNYMSLPQKSKDHLKIGYDFIFIHAFPFDSEMYFNNFKENNLISTLNKMALIKGKMRIILPDMPGFGRSEVFKTKPTNLLPYVKSINEVVNHFQINKLILGGCSMGGYIALEYTRNYPNIIEGLVLIDTKTNADNEEQKQSRLDTIKEIDKSLKSFSENEKSIITMKDLYVKNSNIKSFIDNLYSRIISQKTLKEKPKIAKQILNLMKKQKALGIINALNGMAGRNDTSTVLKSLKIDTLIIVGENDTITPIDNAEEMKKIMSNATLEIIPLAGHLSNMENSFEFNQRILKYLQIKF